MEKKLRNVEHKKLLSIADNYNFSLRRIRAIRREIYLTRIYEDLAKFYINYVNEVEKTLKLFDPLEKSILEKEYFTPLAKNWWISLFSRATYYRMRLNVARKFLDNFSMA